MNKQVEEWAANGLVKQDEAHWTKEDESTNSSLVGECGIRANTEEIALDPSRVRKKPACARDYILN